MTKTELLEDFISYLFTEEYITYQQLHTIVDVPKQYLKQRTKINNLDIQSVSSSFSAVGVSDIGKALELVKERERGIIIISTDTPELPKDKIDDITFKLTDIDRSSTQIFEKLKSKYHK